MTTTTMPSYIPTTSEGHAPLTDAQLATLLQGWGVSTVTNQAAVHHLIQAACRLAAVPDALAGVNAPVLYAAYQRHMLAACLDYLPMHHYATLARIAALTQPAHVYAFLGEHIPNLQAIIMRATVAYL
ncbi:MAG: hypothetical protein ACKO83_06395, partial [Roseiflexaceae bacterium]